MKQKPTRSRRRSARQPGQLTKRATLWQRYKSAPRRVHVLIILCASLSVLLIVSLTDPGIENIIYKTFLPHTSSSPSSPLSLHPHTGETPGAEGTVLPGATPDLVPFPPTSLAVDYASRANSSFALAANLVGLNGINRIYNNGQLMNYLGPSHINLVRVSVDMPVTFPTAASASPQQQSWSQFDQLMSTIQAQGMQPILTIAYLPTWLEPRNDPCNGIGADPSHTFPTFLKNGTDIGSTEWGMLAAQVVAHMDHSFPGIHPDYELWNEPDGTTFLCVASNNPNQDQTRLTEYESLYAAAAPLMEQQAQQDGMTIRIGGPALAVPRTRASTWLPALLDNPATAPYIDFISYHYYHAGQQGDTWSTLLTTTQDPVNGVAGIFEQVSAIVRSGRQPNPAATPIFIDEYNTNTGLPDCCRNDRSYGSLWNSLFVADLLNTVYDIHSPFGAAQAPIGGLTYFAASEPPPGNEFCLFGTWDSAMDCAFNGNIQPYPQYYAYQLLSDPRYLDITNHGFLTAQPLVKTAGLLVLGFYTATRDDVLIVNTGATSYTGLSLGLKNTAISATATGASVYTLNQANPQIGTQALPLQAVIGGYVATINVPAYSTVALSLASGNG